MGHGAMRSYVRLVLSRMIPRMDGMALLQVWNGDPAAIRTYAVDNTDTASPLEHSTPAAIRERGEAWV